MRFRASIIAAAAVACGVAPSAARATELLQNGGFQTFLSSDPGVSDGWTKSASGDWGNLITTRDAVNQFLQPGQAVITGPHSTEVDVNGEPYAVAYDPPEGWQFAVLEAGDQDFYTRISQDFTLSKAGIFSGFAAFLGGDYPPYDDDAYVKIIRSDNSAVTLFSASIDGLGAYGYTPWTGFSLDLGPGTYRIEAGVVNRGDGDNPSWLAIDGFSAREVPEPAAWALMIAGFFGVGAAVRRRRAFA